MSEQSGGGLAQPLTDPRMQWVQDVLMARIAPEISLSDANRQDPAFQAAVAHGLHRLLDETAFSNAVEWLRQSHPGSFTRSAGRLTAIYLNHRQLPSPLPVAPDPDADLLAEADPAKVQQAASFLHRWLPADVAARQTWWLQNDTVIRRDCLSFANVAFVQYCSSGHSAPEPMPTQPVDAASRAGVPDPHAVPAPAAAPSDLQDIPADIEMDDATLPLDLDVAPHSAEPPPSPPVEAIVRATPAEIIQDANNWIRRAWYPATNATIQAAVDRMQNEVATYAATAGNHSRRAFAAARNERTKFADSIREIFRKTPDGPGEQRLRAAIATIHEDWEKSADRSMPATGGPPKADWLYDLRYDMYRSFNQTLQQAYRDAVPDDAPFPPPPAYELPPSQAPMAAAQIVRDFDRWLNRDWHLAQHAGIGATLEATGNPLASGAAAAATGAPSRTDVGNQVRYLKRLIGTVAQTALRANADASDEHRLRDVIAAIRDARTRLARGGGRGGANPEWSFQPRFHMVGRTIEMLEEARRRIVPNAGPSGSRTADQPVPGSQPGPSSNPGVHPCP